MCFRQRTNDRTARSDGVATRLPLLAIQPADHDREATSGAVDMSSTAQLYITRPRTGMIARPRSSCETVRVPHVFARAVVLACSDHLKATRRAVLSGTDPSDDDQSEDCGPILNISITTVDEHNRVPPLQARGVTGSRALG
jgi:hypothetical protein